MADLGPHRWRAGDSCPCRDDGRDRLEPSPRIKPVRILGKGLVHAVGLQLALGIGALVVVLLRVDEQIPSYEVLVTSAHQALGALILAMTAMLAAFSLRMVASSETVAEPLTPTASKA